MRKRFAAFAVFVFATVLLALPAPAWAYSSTPSTAIFVNGEDITTAEGNRVVCGDGYAAYYPATGVLTLHGAHITETYKPTGGSYVDSLSGIYSGKDVDLAIELVGVNTMTCGITAWGSGGNGGSLTISGSGTLSIQSDENWGLHSYRDLTISGSTVLVDTTLGSTIKSDTGAVRIENGAHVEAIKRTRQGSDGNAVTAAQPASATDETNIVVTGEGTYLKATVSEDLSSRRYGAIHSCNDFIVEDGAEVEVTGIAYAANDLTVQSSGSLSVSTEQGPYAIVASGDMVFDNADVYAYSRDGRGIHAVSNFTARNSIVEASSEGSNALYGAADVAIEGGEMRLTSEEGVAFNVVGAVTMTDGLLSATGATSALTVGDLNFGGKNWYQWATSAAGAVTKSEDVAYDSAGRTDTYLRIEPVGTTYELIVTDGEGAGSYVAGTQVTVSADAFNASGHFSGWTVSDPTGAGVLANSSAAQTTFTMPAGAVELTATFNNPHATLKHVAAIDPTCTDAGKAEHWMCPDCGALFSDDAGTNLVDSEDLAIPATGHSWSEPVWSWSEDGTAFIAKSTCANDSKHIETRSAEPVASVETEPTCTEAGVRLYTATVEFNGKEYTAVSREAISALGHDYADGACARCGAADPAFEGGTSASGSSIPATGDVLLPVAGVVLAGSMLYLGAAFRLRRR